MTTVFAALAVFAGGMSASDYSAKSDLVDTTAVGGFGESSNVSWSMADVALEAKGVALVVKKNQCCGPNGECAYILTLANGSTATAWFDALDSKLAIVREARDPNGLWRPIEFRMPLDCGNSRHKVALNAGRAFVWDVPTTTGPFTTKSRYTLHGVVKTVYSNEFDCSLSPGAFDLPDEWSKGYSHGPDGMLVRR